MIVENLNNQTLFMFVNGLYDKALKYIMETNNHKLMDYDIVLDAKFGKEGSIERAKAEDEAYAYYSGR